MATERMLVFGASGQVGRYVLARCMQANIKVLALSRHPPSRHAQSALIRWSGARLPDAVPPLPQAMALLSLGPLDCFATWLDDWQPLAGFPHVVALSSMSAVAKANSPNADERRLTVRLCTAEARLAQRCDELGLPWTVLRPTMIWGAGMDRNVTAVARFAMRWRVLPQPASNGLRQPLHADDLAAAVLAAASTAAASGCCIECGGGERLSSAEMFSRIRASVPQRTVAIPVPHLLVAGLARVLGKHRLGAVIQRLSVDLVADNTRLESLLGMMPRGFRPVSSNWCDA